MAPLFTELADQWRLSDSDPVVTRVLIGWAPTLQVAIPDGLLDGPNPQVSAAPAP